MKSMTPQQARRLGDFIFRIAQLMLGGLIVWFVVDIAIRVQHCTCTCP